MKIIWKEIKNTFSLFPETYTELLDDKVYKMTAALSYYTLLSLSPLLLISIAIAGFFFGEEAARGEIVNQIDGLIGTSGAEVIQSMLQSASIPAAGIVATIISVIVILIGSVGAFVELKESLNIIWGVETKPGQPIKNIIKTRLNAFSMVIVVGFMLIASLVISAMLTGFNKYLGYLFPSILPMAQITNFFITGVIITFLFAIIFKYLPDIKLQWKYVWRGAIITSILFSIGKYLIGIYIGSSSYNSTFGAAGSLVVLLVWLNYSSLILFFGAEFTQIFHRHYSKSPIVADKDGIVIPKVSQLIKKKVQENKKVKKNEADQA